MGTNIVEIGRVLRVGRGWADVEVAQQVRRISTRRDLLVRAGCYLKIVNKHGIAVLSASDYHRSHPMKK